MTNKNSNRRAKEGEEGNRSNEDSNETQSKRRYILVPSTSDK